MFDFVPRFIAISNTKTSMYYNSAYFVFDTATALSNRDPTNVRYVTLRWNGATVYWYSNDYGQYQLNISGDTYKYVAIG